MLQKFFFCRVNIKNLGIRAKFPGQTSIRSLDKSFLFFFSARYFHNKYQLIPFKTTNEKSCSEEFSICIICARSSVIKYARLGPLLIIYSRTVIMWQWRRAATTTGNKKMPPPKKKMNDLETCSPYPYSTKYALPFSPLCASRKKVMMNVKRQQALYI